MTGHNERFASRHSWNHPALARPENFLARTAAQGDLDFFIASNEGIAKEVVAEAERVRTQLEAADKALFESLRARMRAGLRGELLLAELNARVPYAARLSTDAPGYDALDVLLDGVLLPGEPAVPTAVLTPDMVGLQQAPARVILELTERLTERWSTRSHTHAFQHGKARGRFYDIGSGLGRVPLLVHLLTGCAVHGVDLEPAFVDFARARAADLQLESATFTTDDARSFDLGSKAGIAGYIDDGENTGGADTAYFLYTPFRGPLLAHVLTRIQSQTPHARLFTYGPCSAEVAAHTGYRRVMAGDISPDRLEEFSAR